jgi:hypothetical protein
MPPPIYTKSRPGTPLRAGTSWLIVGLAVSLCVSLAAQATYVTIVAGSHTFHVKGCPQISGYAESYLELSTGPPWTLRTPPATSAGLTRNLRHLPRL